MEGDDHQSHRDPARPRAEGRGAGLPGPARHRGLRGRVPHVPPRRGGDCSMKTVWVPLLLSMSVLLGGCSDGGGARADRTPAGSPRDTGSRVRVAAVHEAGAESPSFLTYIEA